MAERVALLGGRFEIRSKPGQGCRICVRIPMETSLALEGPEMSKADPQTWDVMDL
jgi:signal transduction histidine kinase